MNPCAGPLPGGLIDQLIDRALFAARVYCRVVSHHDREDLVQDAVTALLARLQRGSVIDDPFKWVVGAVRRLHRARRRTESRRRVARLDCDTDAEAAVDGVSQPDLEPTCGADGWEVLEELLSNVTPGYTEPEKDILRRLAAGATRRRIAADLGTSAGKLERRVKKLLERMRFFLTLDHGTCGDADVQRRSPDGPLGSQAFGGSMSTFALTFPLGLAIGASLLPLLE